MPPVHLAWIAFIGGCAAFAHCLGMCGAFALHLSKPGGGWGGLTRQILWHAGKLATYIFLGAMAGFLGGWLTSLPALPAAQKVLAWAAGLLMIVMGLVLLGLFPSRGRPATEPGGLFSSLFGQFFANPSRPAALVLGLATGFLPCPIVVGFLALSAESRSVVSGMVVMAAMGIGTVWSLLILGMTGSMLAPRLKRWGPAIGGAVLILLGIVTALRGTDVFHRVLGCPPSQDNCCSHETGK